MSNTETIPHPVARSSDGRTNLWRVVCPKCSRVMQPRSTMYATQNIDCKCGASLIAYYNEEPPVVRLVL